MRKGSLLLLVAFVAFWARRPPVSARRRRRESSSSSEERQPIPPVQRMQEAETGQWQCPRHANSRDEDCGAFCSLDGPCPENEICCQYDCCQECLLPIDEHPGYCPKSNPSYVDVCLTNCTSDAECGTNQKCCQWGCVSTCVDAEPTHPGVCPQKRVTRNDAPCTTNCKNDQECLPWQKCCFTGCSLQCTDLQEDICALPKDSGSCTLSLTYYYFSFSTKTCEQFQYSGCKGNANRFYTKEECMQVCGKTVKEGTCPECTEVSGKCNRFCSEDANCPGDMRCCKCGCSQKCMLPVGANPGYCPQANSSNINTCLETSCTTDDECGAGEKCCNWDCASNCMPAEPEHPGVCPEKEVVPTLLPCNNTCTDDRDCPASQKCCFSNCGLDCMVPETDICKLPPEKGSCKAFMPMFYYSSKTTTCEMFIYGGCEGNGNRFPTQEICLATCRYRDICKLPVDPGGCGGHKLRYHYNHASKTCESFVYHGCDGNENRFHTMEQCLTACFYPEVCILPPDPGSCNDSIPMYHYDAHKKSCEIFMYGGCDGNANRFPLLQQCEEHCRHPDICLLPSETGPCTDYTRQYYYSPAEKKCQPFPYGGCGGNINRFSTIEACTETCTRKDFCTLPPDRGHCNGHQLQYYYDPNTRNCETFIFGGCGGNENRFETLKKCTWFCRNPDICKLSPETGPCRAALLRYYYDPVAKSCEVFQYGGCGGNDNRFETLAQCEFACKRPAICKLPDNSGEGNLGLTMYYYDPVGTVCEEFIYKGRKGNPNRFATLTECQETCRDPDTCHLPSKSGPCEEHLPRYYYNSSSGTCSEFSYGGCRSITNNFESKEECQQTCKGPEKPGFCPSGDPPQCIITCLKDCECPGAQKCCSDYCGQVCKDPVQEKPGSCPPAPKVAKCSAERPCGSDSDCPEEEKCCGNGCTHSCTKPASKK